MTMEYSGNRNYEPSEDISHERFPDHEKNHHKFTKKKPASTPSYLSPIGATTDDLLIVNQVTSAVPTGLLYLPTYLLPNN